MVKFDINTHDFGHNGSNKKGKFWIALIETLIYNLFGLVED